MIKNYTSNVPIERTVSHIEQRLAESGADGIMKEYANGQLTALSFRVTLPENGQKISVRLPANVEAVYAALSKEVKKPHAGTMARIREQSGKTAWKLMQDWCEVQLSLIAMQQAEFRQVFLAYIMYDGKRTFFERLKADNFLALAAPKKE
jgi:hypothetical protein